MNSLMRTPWLVCFTLAVIITGIAADASAQCATCPTATVAYQPVVAQPTVTYTPYTGWYPGKWLDQWRMRRAGAVAAPAYTAAYAPTYTAAYAPAYTAAYAPAYTTSYAPTSYNVGYRPYVTSYAPLAPANCSTCVQTVARPVVMQPVVATVSACDSCGCNPCGCDTCGGGCSACSSGVSQAVYTDSGCASCAAGSSYGNVVPESSYGGSVGPQTPQPTLEPVPDAGNSRYGTQKPEDSNNVDPLEKFDPGPGTEADPSTFYNAPRLLDPRDRTARSSQKLTTNVWTAVYRGPSDDNRPTVNQASTRGPRTQAEIDAEGWTAVPPRR